MTDSHELREERRENFPGDGEDEYKSVSPFYDFLLEPLIHRIRLAVVDLVADLEAQTVLDLCCGTGKQLSPLPEYIDARGIDLSPAMLERAEKRGVNCIRGDVTDTPFPDNAFDAVLSQFALHEKNPSLIEKELLETKRILKQDGHFIVVDFSYPIEKKLFSRFIRGGIRQIEGLMGGDHFLNYKLWMKEGALFSILNKKGWACEKRIFYYKGNIALGLFKEV